MMERPKRPAWKLLQVITSLLYLVAARDETGHRSGTLAAVEVRRSGEASLLDLANEGDSLSDVAFAATVGYEDPRCQRTLSKVESIMHFEAQRLISEGLGSHQMNLIQAVSEALTELKKGKTDEKTLELILVGLGNVTLKTALQMGEVWSSSDQSDLFYYCFPGLSPIHALEESKMAADFEQWLFADVSNQQTWAPLNVSGTEIYEKHDVYYCYRPGTTDAVKRAFVAARRHIQEQVPCLSFKAINPRVDSPEEDWCEQEQAILVRDQNNGCWSQHRKYTNGTNSLTALLNIGRGCEIKGMVVHELSKLLGLRRELKRADREKYVNLHPANLRHPSWVDLFKIWTPPAWTANSAPPAEAYVNDPFDFLSISFDTAQAFTNGTGSFVETAKDALAARFLGQRMGLSELDVEELNNRYNCPTKPIVQNPTRVLSENLLAGTALSYDGSCKDRAGANLGFLVGETGAAGCRVATTELCRGSAKTRMQAVCPLSCLFCIPAVQSIVEQKNHLVLRPELFQYCDDHGCQEADPEGLLCKKANPTAKSMSCSLVKVYCDDNGCSTTDPGGRSCREKNPTAKEITCAVSLRANGSNISQPADRVNLTGHAKDASFLTFGCVDDEVTGIKFKHGNIATCSELKGYCGHAKLGSRVRLKCGATCAGEGFPCSGSALETSSNVSGKSAGDLNASANASSIRWDLPDPGCTDAPAERKPVLMVHGRAQSCPEIRSYCLNHANSNAVQQKCPLTCASCVPKAAPVGYAVPDVPSHSYDVRDYPAEALEDNTETTTAVTTTHYEWTTPPPPVYDSLPPDSNQTMGCDRRRRWGFCYSRRRRFDT